MIRRNAISVALALLQLLASANAFAPSKTRSVVAQPRRHSGVVFLPQQQQQHSTASTTALPMALPAVAGFGAIAGAVSGGLFAGGLHAIAGTVRDGDTVTN